MPPTMQNRQTYGRHWYYLILPFLTICYKDLSVWEFPNIFHFFQSSWLLSLSNFQNTNCNYSYIATYVYILCHCTKGLWHNSNPYLCGQHLGKALGSLVHQQSKMYKGNYEIVESLYISNMVYCQKLLQD